MRLLATIVLLATLFVTTEAAVAKIPMPPDVGLTPERKPSVVSQLSIVPFVDGLQNESEQDFWQPLLPNESTAANVNCIETPFPPSGLPFVNSSSPLNWDYEPLSAETSQPFDAYSETIRETDAREQKPALKLKTLRPTSDSLEKIKPTSSTWYFALLPTMLAVALFGAFICMHHQFFKKPFYKPLPPVLHGYDYFDHPNDVVYSWHDEPQSTPIASIALDQISNSRKTGRQNAWRLGVHSIAGNVRSENQDCGVAFELDGYQILLIADGCGGVPYGADASRTAVEECAKSICWQLIGNSSSPGKAIESGIRAASNALLQKGRRLELETLEAGLRTTLIVAVGTNSDFHWGYIGDGALKVLEPSGHIHECMVPHRSDALVTNVLAASLGPTIHGNADFGSMPRKAGDVLLAGTDGVFDRVDDGFARNLMRMAIYQAGDLAATTRESLDQLSVQTDSTGAFVCDDNLTLGMMADGNRPDFRPIFWKTTNTTLSNSGEIND
jgi:serine/threonine protein phosphatase PrpC